MATDMLPKLTSSDYTRGIGVTLLTPRARGSFTLIAMILWQFVS